MESRLAYSFAALWTAITHQPIDFVFCGHLFMAPLATIIAKLLGSAMGSSTRDRGLARIVSAAAPVSGIGGEITSVSRYTRRRLLQWVAIDPARVKVLPNTVSPQYHPGPKPAYLLERHDAGGKKLLVTVSRLNSSEQYKGHDRVIRTLPRILERHPDTIYLIVGDGDDRRGWSRWRKNAEL